jgi:transposase
MNKIDFETRQYFREMFMKGEHSLKEIAEILGISYGSACNLKKWYFPDANSTNQKIDKKLTKQFKALYLSKRYSLTEIAKKLGICRNTAYKLKNMYFKGDNYSKWRKKMFEALYKSGNFSIEEITVLIRASRVTVLRFKRQYEKFNQAKT